MGHAVATLLLSVWLLRLSADTMTAVECAASVGPRDDSSFRAQFGRDMIKGLKMEKLPDMDKVDIGNDEFHCKYLEYYRRLYADETEPDDDVSAIQVQGRLKHYPDDAEEGSTGSTATTGDDDEARWTTTTITFPIDPATVRAGKTAAVVKSVARIHGAAPAATRWPVTVYGRLLAGSTWGKPSPLAELTWPAAGDGGRWKDLDVTRLLQPRKRRGDVTALELSFRRAAGARFDDRRPVLHVFFDGTTAGTAGTTCPPPDETTTRRRRDAAAAAAASRRSGEGAGGRARRRRPAAAAASMGGGGAFGRTDCKAAGGARSGNGTDNKCCREKMRVVFADIGYDFVVEPKWFDAGLCRGRCPFKYNSATQHALIQSLLWRRHNKNRNRDRDRDDGQTRSRRRVRHGAWPPAAGQRSRPQQPPPPPKPCCAPNVLDRLEILHVDENNSTRLMLTTWEQTVVVECACS